MEIHKYTTWKNHSENKTYACDSLSVWGCHNNHDIMITNKLSFVVLNWALCVCALFYGTHVYNVSVTRTNYVRLHHFTFQLEFRTERPIQFFEESIQLTAAWHACWPLSPPLFYHSLSFSFFFWFVSLHMSLENIYTLVSILFDRILFCESEIWFHKKIRCLMWSFQNTH